MLWRRHRRTTPHLGERELATVWQVASLLLDYPTPDLVCRVPTLRAALTEVPAAIAADLTAYLDLLETTDLGELQRDYVDTFDITRKCSLHLTYALSGDTRRRGVALVQVRQVYRAAGVELTDEGAELPDHLSIVLEFGACVDRDAAWKLLNDHRVALELLGAALARRESRWLGVVDAVRATLPPLDGDGAQALRRLVAAGPPTEDVGLEPYAIDPRLSEPTPAHSGISTSASASASVDLGPTIPVGAPR